MTDHGDVESGLFIFQLIFKGHLQPILEYTGRHHEQPGTYVYEWYTQCFEESHFMQTLLVFNILRVEILKLHIVFFLVV